MAAWSSTIWARSVMVTSLITDIVTLTTIEKLTLTWKIYFLLRGVSCVFQSFVDFWTWKIRVYTLDIVILHRYQRSQWIPSCTNYFALRLILDNVLNTVQFHPKNFRVLWNDFPDLAGWKKSLDKLHIAMIPQPCRVALLFQHLCQYPLLQHYF